MAYTYDEFVSAATGAGLLDKFSEDDLNIAKMNPEYGMSALKLQQDLQGANTTEQKLLAQETINQLRNSYSTMKSTNPGGVSFTYGNETAYQKALNDVLNQQPFQYDAAKDPSYGALKKSYLREGDRAREDTLARVSAATGGTPPSFAVTAAQQAGDYYSGKLGDALPSMEQNAYQRYLSDYEQKLSALGALNTDRNASFAQHQQAFENAQAMYKQLGYATPEIAQILGIPMVEEETPSVGGYLPLTEIDAATLNQLKQNFPSGVITNDDAWAILKKAYGENALRAAGYSNGQPTTQVNATGIRMMQQQLGVPMTGVWDTATAAAAQKKWGTSNPDDAAYASKGGFDSYTTSKMEQLLKKGSADQVASFIESVVDRTNEQQFRKLMQMAENAGYVLR